MVTACVVLVYNHNAVTMQHQIDLGRKSISTSRAAARTFSLLPLLIASCVPKRWFIASPLSKPMDLCAFFFQCSSTLADNSECCFSLRLCSSINVSYSCKGRQAQKHRCSTSRIYRPVELWNSHLWAFLALWPPTYLSSLSAPRWIANFHMTIYVRKRVLYIIYIYVYTVHIAMWHIACSKLSCRKMCNMFLFFIALQRSHQTCKIAWGTSLTFLLKSGKDMLEASWSSTHRKEKRSSQ